MFWICPPESDSSVNDTTTGYAGALEVFFDGAARLPIGLDEGAFFNATRQSFNPQSTATGVEIERW